MSVLKEGVKPRLRAGGRLEGAQMDETTVLRAELMLGAEKAALRKGWAGRT